MINRREFLKAISGTAVTISAFFGSRFLVTQEPLTEERLNIIYDGEFVIVNNWYLKKTDLTNV